MTVRLQALGVLLQVVRHDVSLDKALDKCLENNASHEQISLLKELCYGVMRWWPRLKAIEHHLLDKPLANKHLDISVLLWLGFYQLEKLNIAEHAAVSETVACAPAIKKQWAKGLINALLRRFQREKENIVSQLENNTDFTTAHSESLIKALRQAWPQDWRKIVDANNSRAPMSLRVNRLKISRDDYIAELSNEQIDAKTSEVVASAIVLSEPCAVDKLPGFREGLVSVQDIAAQLAAELMAPQPGERIVDACAAPGGKTCHILESQSELDLVAIDNKAVRLKRVTENLKRLGLSCQLHAVDAVNLDAWWNGTEIDRLLLDAPCSGSGVIRRHPDIKWLRQSVNIDELVASQRRLLGTLWRTLKPGGVMLYATCSILPEENHEQIAWFLSEHDDAEEWPIAAEWGRAMSFGRTILPGEHDMDGFYYARLRKISR